MTKVSESQVAKLKGSRSYNVSFDKTRLLTPAIIILVLLFIIAFYFFAKHETSKALSGLPQRASNQSVSPVKENETRLKLTIGETGSALGDEVKITVTKIQMDKASSKYKVFATVVFPSNKKVGIMDAEVGYKLSYPKEAAFEIEILDIKEASTLFLVKKIDKS